VKSLLAILLIRAFALGVLIGILACAAAPAFSATPRYQYQTTKQRLRVFTRELDRAADELRVARPVARAVSLEETLAAGLSPLVIAWVWAPEGVDSRGVQIVKPVNVSIVWFQLMSASDAQLRCWARHEMTHVLFGHEYGALEPREAVRRHDQVRHFMKAKWGQDYACLIEG